MDGRNKYLIREAGRNEGISESKSVEVATNVKKENIRDIDRRKRIQAVSRLEHGRRVCKFVQHFERTKVSGDT
jgi:hypothetical protein